MSGYVPTLLEVRATIDGTLTYFDLINGGNGLFLDEWEPSVIQEKGGGVFSDSPMSDGKSLVFERWDNAVENIKVKAKAQTGNGISLELQDLYQLFQMAKSYSKTAWQTNPVYLALRPAGQDNEQYAPIVIGRVPNLSNPVRQPWYKAFTRGGAAIDNLPIIIERGHWLENVPGTGTAIEAIATNTFNSVKYGNCDVSGTDEPTTEDIVFVANKRNEANLTHIYVDDGGSFGSNLIGTVPATLLPATPAVNDALYLGCQTSVTNSGPFSNLVFDIGTAGVGYGASWEYWNGSAWGTFAVLEPVTDLTVAGVGIVNWIQMSDWAATAVNGVTAYWIRLRVTSVTTPTPPTQQNRRIYTITWPYVEVRSGQVSGDIPALGKLISRLRSNETGVGVAPASGLFVGLRSTSRGDDFTAYINLANEQNPSGVSLNLGTGMSYGTDTTAPAGVSVQYSHSLDGDLKITLSSAIANDFIGRYRAFARVNQTSGSAGDFFLQLKIDIPGYPTTPQYLSVSDSVFTTTTGGIETLDFGEVIVPAPMPGNSFSTVRFTLSLNNVPNLTRAINLIDLILIPVDEVSFEAYQPERTVDYWDGTTAKLYVDSISNYGKTTAYLGNPSTNAQQGGFTLSTPSGFTLPRNKTFRLWFFASSSVSVAYPETIQSVQLERCQRYLGLRATN